MVSLKRYFDEYPDALGRIDVPEADPLERNRLNDEWIARLYDSVQSGITHALAAGDGG